MQSFESSKSPIAADDRRPLDYQAPGRPQSRTGAALPGPRVWVSLVLYVLSLVTPTTTASDPNDRLHDRVTMGYQTAFASIGDWPQAVRGDSGQPLDAVFLAPVVNFLFIAALVLAFAAARGGPRSARLGRASRMIAAIGVPMAVIGTALLAFGTSFGNAWGSDQSRISVGVFFWCAAFLVLGLQFHRRRKATAG